MAIQQLMLGAGGKTDPVYMDDLFSNQLWTGNSTVPRSITTGFDMASDGGMVWIKKRNSGTESDHIIGGTGVGDNNYISSNSSSAKTAHSGRFRSLTSTGFEIGSSGYVNETHTYSSWAFKQAKGFFDVVTYTGNSTNRTISHNLGCKPGMILFKNLDAGENWRGYHRELGATQNIEINNGNAAGESTTAFNNTEPTATTFSVGTDGATNGNGQSIVAYLFAGGESPAATARSVYYDEASNLSIAPHADIDFGSGNWTIEGWWKSNKKSTSSDAEGLFALGNYAATGGMLLYQYDGDLKLNKANTDVLDIQNNPFYSKFKQWWHVALVKSGTTVTIYVDGNPLGSYTDSGTFGDSSNHSMYIGTSHSAHNWNGSISNFRVVKGTAVYTSAFKPPTEPLTSITNTKLLCCNNSSVTGSTVTPGTITASGSTLVASTDSPFDDPNGFKFGENGDQNVIKTGSYIGNGSSTGPEINLGFEPQFIIVKTTISGENWRMWDVGRGINEGNDATLYPSLSSAEANNSDALEVTSTGFKIKGSSTAYNGDGNKVIYMAVRRPDGYVGKPIQTGTNAFNIANYDSTAPAFNANFPVDFALMRRTNATYDWRACARLLSKKYVIPNSTNGTANENDYTFDYHDGWNSQTSYGNNEVSWMWKRHAGMDVVTYTGNGNNTDGANPHAHNLGKVPEMIWIKTRSDGQYSGVTHWTMSHKGLNGGTNPWQYTMSINNNWAEATTTNFGNTAPTSTHFYVGDPGNGRSNGNNSNYMAMLFASVDGVSKVGYFNGSSSSQTITTGFQPRFVILKRADGTSDWHVIDTTRGWGSGNDKYLALQSTQAEAEHDFGAPTSTGFTLTSNTEYNGSGGKYIYYAHA